MLISSPAEFRLYVSSHAFDEIASVQGILSISENDFLADKLGATLYASLVAYYRSLNEEAVAAFVEKVSSGATDLTPIEKLLQLSQRCIAYDALARNSDIHALSVNSAGINVSEAEDYKKPDAATLANFKAAANREAHASVNMLLTQLEQWCTVNLAALGDETPEEGTEAYYASQWQSDSRYYYLAAQLIFPTAVILNDYMNIYESREKFIQYLPAIRSVQENIVEGVIGEETMEYLIENASVYDRAKPSTLLEKSVHRVRKATAAFLEEYLVSRKAGATTQGAVLNAYQKEAIKAHDEGIAILDTLVSVWVKNLASLDAALIDALVAGPLCDRFDLTSLSARTDLNSSTTALVEAAVSASSSSNNTSPAFENNAKGNVIFVFPAIH